MKLHTLIALVVPFVCRGTEILWQFDGGSLDRVEKTAPDHFRVFVNGQTDQDKRNRQASWYYFRVDGADAHDTNHRHTGTARRVQLSAESRSHH